MTLSGTLSSSRIAQFVCGVLVAIMTLNVGESAFGAGPRLVALGRGSCGELQFVPPCTDACHPAKGENELTTEQYNSALPSVVIIHGFNPFPKLVRFDLGPAARCGALTSGAPVNLFVWDWNLATKASLRPQVNVENARRQGIMLAESLGELGIAPHRTHLVGHSLGCVVAASAARRSWELTGERTDQVTLLDPLRGNHEVIFDVEGVADAANWVENLWAPGLSGFGAPANRAGVVDIRTPGSTPLRGLFLAHRMNHVDVLRRFLRDGD
jgi:pimeloyl-ACP methyl ester carboxylesterase